MPGCRDCFHRFLCAILENKGYQQDCKQFVDRSLFVVLPCKVGDTVYCVQFSEIIEKEICGIHISGVNKECIGLYDDCHDGWFASAADIGKTVFLTKEEAERALEGI